MSDDFDTLSGTLDAVWQMLEQALKDRNAPARHPTLASVDADGHPRQRTLILRAIDRDAAWLDMHTDAASHKIAQITARPNVALHIWDPAPKLQLRLAANCALITGPEAETAWSQVPEASRPGYRADPPPGTPIPSGDAWSATAAPRFAILRCHLTRIETLLIGQPHKRAAFDGVNGWVGGWLTP